MQVAPLICSIINFIKWRLFCHQIKRLISWVGKKIN